MIGIYHPFEANRKALIKELGNGNDVCFEEIDNWRKIKTSSSDLVVIYSPLFLPDDLSVDKYKAFFQECEKTLIIVTYHREVWLMNRRKTFYIENSDSKKTMDEVRTIILLETMNRLQEYSKEPKQGVVVK